MSKVKAGTTVRAVRCVECVRRSRSNWLY
jgi:hypothetical protein